MSPRLLAIPQIFGLAHAQRMITTRLSAGAVTMRAGNRGVVLEVVGDRLIIAPVEVEPSPMLRGDVSIDPTELGLALTWRPGMAVRCGSTALVPAAGQVAIGQVPRHILERLRQAARRAASAMSAEYQPGSTAFRTLMPSSSVGCRGRMVGRQNAT